MTRNNNNGKLRAVFLAALMVLWVFAGTVAFAGGAAAADVTYTPSSFDGQEPFQGQEIEIDLTGTSGMGEDIQLRRVTDTNDNGEPLSSGSPLRTESEDGGSVSFDTEGLETGEYVLRVEGGDFLNTTANDFDGSLSEMAGNNEAASINIITQTMSTSFENDDDESEVRAGEDIEFQFSSNQRGSGFFVNVTEADGELDNEDLEELFFGDDTNSLTDVGGATLEDGNVNDDDDEILIRMDDNDFEEEFTVGEDTPEGEYELEFSVNDSTAESTASLTVLEDIDADASFDQGTFTETRGDIVEISGTVEGNSEYVNLTVGDREDDGYEANVTVEVNDDDEFTVLFNTRMAGQPDADYSTFGNDIDDMTSANEHVFGTAEDQGDIVSANNGTDTLDAVLVAGTYDLQLHAPGTDRDDLGEWDIATMDLTERSTDSVAVWRAPQDLAPEDEELEDAEALQQAMEDGILTEADTVSIGDADDGRQGTADTLVFEIGVSGVQGVGTGAQELLNPNANNGQLALEMEQLNPSSNRDALELNHTDSNIGGFDIILDRDNDVIYAVANAETLRVDRGSPASQVRLPVDEEFEVRYNVSANYLNNFDRDGDLDVGADEDDEIVSTEISVEDREINFETLDGDISVPPTEDAEITGTTTIAPGTEFDIRAQGSGDAAFLRTAEDTVVAEDGSFAGTVDMSDIETGTEFDATVRNQGFEEDGDTSGVVQESEGAVFAVSDLSPAEAEAMQGDTITVSATITNDGDTNGTQTVALTIDGNEIATEEVELDAGGETTVEFADVDTSELEEGDHEHAIQTDDDSASGTLTITVEGGDDGAADDGGDDGASDDGASDDGASDDSSADDSSGDDGAADDGETEDQPGFGAVIALIALLGAALLAARRNN